ncbi:MAG: hypothetical protein QMC67_06215 [Candidatus Wallbacteria bacterium]
MTPTAKEKTNTKDAVEYTIHGTYKVNDRIHHNSFNDIGTVIDVGVTKDNEKKMVVEFEKVGRKRLIMGVIDSRKAAK